MNKKVLKVLLLSIAVLSLVSWIYRLTEEYWKPKELPVYVLVCLGPLALFATSLWLISLRPIWVRVLGVILGIPFFVLWTASVLVGFFGLRIH